MHRFKPDKFPAVRGERHKLPPLPRSYLQEIATGKGTIVQRFSQLAKSPLGTGLFHSRASHPLTTYNPDFKTLKTHEKSFYSVSYNYTLSSCLRIYRLFTKTRFKINLIISKVSLKGKLFVHFLRKLSLESLSVPLLVYSGVFTNVI